MTSFIRFFGDLHVVRADHPLRPASIRVIEAVNDEGITEIISTDRGFDQVGELRRIAPDDFIVPS